MTQRAFDLQQQKLELAHKIVMEAESDHKWRQLGDLAMAGAQFQLAIDCLERAKDYAALLLIYSSQVFSPSAFRFRVKREKGRIQWFPC